MDVLLDFGNLKLPIRITATSANKMSKKVQLFIIVINVLVAYALTVIDNYNIDTD